MPKLDVDMFDTEPHVGNKVKVIGKVKSIDEDTGEVEVSYDKVTIIKKHKSRDNSDDNNDDMQDLSVDETVTTSDNGMNLDQALANKFGYTQ